MNTEAFVQRFKRISLSGTMKDALGDDHKVQDVIEHLDDWLQKSGEALILWELDPIGKAADELKRIRKEIGKLK